MKFEYATPSEIADVRLMLRMPMVFTHAYIRRFNELYETLDKRALLCTRTLSKYLRTACKAGDVLTALIILNQGIHPDDMCDSFTACMWAAHYGHVECLIVLLERGANPGIVVRGMTPLYKAVYRGHSSCVRVLIDARADTNRECIGLSPLSIAVMGGDVPVVSILLASGASPERASLRYATICKDPVCMQLLIDHNGDPNVQGDDGITPLMGVCNSRVTNIDALACVRALLGAGAEVNARDFNDNSAIDRAVRSRGASAPFIVRELLRAGATLHPVLVLDGHPESISMLHRVWVGGWTVHNHDLMPVCKRTKAVFLALIGKRLSVRYNEPGFHDVWHCVMFWAV